MFGVSPHINRTSDVGIEEVRVEVRALDLKFNAMQSSIDAVMVKLGITVSRMANAPSCGKQPSNDYKKRSNSRMGVSPLARS